MPYAKAIIEYQDPYSEDVSTVDRPQADVTNKQAKFWETADPILNAHGKLVRGGMFEPQRRWWNLETFVKVFCAGFGSGKTITGAKRIIATALQNAPVASAAVSPTFPLAKKTIIPTLDALLAGKRANYGKQFWYKLNKADHHYTIRYRGRTATIYVLSAEDPDALRGPNLGSVWLDEPFLMVREVFDHMLARIRHPDASIMEMVLTGTSESLGWGFDLCCGELKDQLRESGVAVGLIQASTRSNLALHSSYVKRLEGAFTSKMVEAYIEGGFVNMSEGLVYYAFTPKADIEDHCNVRDLPVPDECELGCGMDFNVNPMSACVFWRAGAHMHIFDEIELPNSDTEYMCSLLREKYVDAGRLTAQVLEVIYPDASGAARKTSSPSGKTDFHYIREAGFQISAPSSNPHRKDRYNAVNGKFRPKEGKTTLTVSPKCKKLIKYFQTYTHEQMNQQTAMSHLCFGPDTLVDTDHGFVKISQMPREGKVRTWNGQYVPYTDCSLIKRNSNRVRVCIGTDNVVDCTPDHLWLTTEGWVCAENLSGSSLLGWQSKLSRMPSKDFVGVFTGFIPVVSIFKQLISIMEGRFAFIEQCGRTILDQSQKVMTFITRITTDQTTTGLILNCSPDQTIRNTTSNTQVQREKPSHWNLQRLDKLLRLRGIGVLKVVSGIESIMRKCEEHFIKSGTNTPVLFVKRFLSHALNLPTCAVIDAPHATVINYNSTTLNSLVSDVEKFSKEISTSHKGFVAKVAQVGVVGKGDVYCLTVPEYGCFCLADGSIVSNCDAASYPVIRLFPAMRDRSGMYRLIQG